MHPSNVDVYKRQAQYVGEKRGRQMAFVFGTVLRHPHALPLLPGDEMCIRDRHSTLNDIHYGKDKL